MPASDSMGEGSSRMRHPTISVPGNSSVVPVVSTPRRSGGKTPISPSQMLEAKRTVQYAEEDVRLLKNRLAKLEQEEQLALKKSEMARQQAEKIRAAKDRHARQQREREERQRKADAARRLAAQENARKAQQR
ncbi:hypothetical protein KIPB_008687, partial [Kipferlia bialata]|eukprot:g4123.t1